MLTYFTNEPVPQKISKRFREVALDAPLQWHQPNKEGFKVFGVSAGVVFVVYCEQTLVACQHWGCIPGSSDPQDVVSQYVDNKFTYLEHALREKNGDLEKFTIYAVGAQESSQNLMNELRARTNTTSFNFNTDNLHLAHGEDTFDFYAQVGAPTFFAEHHPEIMEQDASPLLVQYGASNPAQGLSSDINENILQTQRRMRNTHL